MASGIRDHFVEVEGVRLHWSEAGEASDTPPVVLLHGLNNSCLSWSCVAALLATDRRVLMPDLPGHGRSGRPDAGYELAWYARIIARWLESIGIEQADVVGHSFGGGVAQMLLLECPKRVRRLVLVAPGGLGKGVGWWLRLASFPRVVEYLGQPFMALGTRLALREARKGVTRNDVADLSRFNSRAGSARASHGACATSSTGVVSVATSSSVSMKSRSFLRSSCFGETVTQLFLSNKVALSRPGWKERCSGSFGVPVTFSTTNNPKRS